MEKPIKHFGKLSLEPGFMPSSMDKFKLNKFSISGLTNLKINVLKNNSNDILENMNKETTNVYNKINKKLNNNINNQESQDFIYNENEFPSLGS